MDVCIVNYNTQRLTDYAIRSINKHTPGCTIYIFDNSDKEPFVNTFSNVKVFDNTKGQIIDFNKWLEKYPNRIKSTGKCNDWASAKHCYTIEKCMELLPNGFVLMDSDILVLKDFSGIVDENCIFVGDVVKQAYPGRHERILPYICYINSKLCKEKGVHYFDDNYMHGLKNTVVNPLCDEFDTGAAFWLHTSKFNYKKINHKDYITHYKGGSWDDRASRSFGGNPKNEDVWLREYRRAWCENKPNVIYTCISGDYDALKEPNFVDENFDYICFTDQNLSSAVWQILPLPEDVKNLSQVKKQRKVKVNPHLYLSEYKFSIWVDANISLNASPSEYVKEHCTEDKGVFFVGQHPERDCVYEEGEACLKYKKDTKENIDKQLNGYRAQNYPEHNGMVQTCVLFRYHNNPECIKLDEFWWKEIEAKSHRDQLSANYAFWKNPDTKVVILDKTIFKSKEFTWKPGHKSRFFTKKVATAAQVNKPTPVTKVEDKPILREPTVKRVQVKHWNQIMN